MSNFSEEEQIEMAIALSNAEAKAKAEEEERKKVLFEEWSEKCRSPNSYLSEEEKFLKQMNNAIEASKKTNKEDEIKRLEGRFDVLYGNMNKNSKMPGYIFGDCRNHNLDNGSSSSGGGSISLEDEDIKEAIARSLEDEEYLVKIKDCYSKIYKILDTACWEKIKLARIYNLLGYLGYYPSTDISPDFDFTRMSEERQEATALGLNHRIVNEIILKDLTESEKIDEMCILLDYRKGSSV